MPNMTPDHLTPAHFTPADPAYLRSIIAQALVRRRNGRRTQDYADVMAIAAAEHLAEAMRLAGLVVMQAPPAPAHTGARPDHAATKAGDEPV